MQFTASLALAAAVGLAPAAASAAEKLKMATIAPGTSSYLTMTTFANIVNKQQDEFEISVDATGAATKHMVELARGKLDICMTAPTIYHFLKHNKAMYKKLENGAELAENMRLIMWFPYGQYHAVAYEGSGIETLHDIKGKRVFLGPPGGGAWAGSYGWIKSSTGLDVKKGDFHNVKASWSSALQGFQDRQFDVYISGGIAPYPIIEQLALTSKIRLLGMTEDEYAKADGLQQYIGALLGRELGVIPADAYGDNVVTRGDVHTVGAIVGIAVQTGMPDHTAYAITKTF